MAAYTFTRLSSGTVKVERGTEIFFINGATKIDPNDANEQIVIQSQFGDRLEINLATDTVTGESGTATEIAEALATDIFFLASSGGGETNPGALSNQYPASLSAMRAMGSAVIGQSSVDYSLFTAGAVLTSQTVIYTAVWLPQDGVITGIKFFQVIQGSYTANNNNYVALYSYLNGTITQVAVSVNDGNVWKGTSNTMQTVPFTTPYNADAGVYFVGALYSSSAQTTAPSIGGGAGTFTNANSADMTNSAKLYAVQSGQTDLPASRAMSALSGTLIRPWIGIY